MNPDDFHPNYAAGGYDDLPPLPRILARLIRVHRETAGRNDLDDTALDDIARRLGVSAVSLRQDVACLEKTYDILGTTLFDGR